jgi:membrane protease YdiL (CAAX protease family)
VAAPGGYDFFSAPAPSAPAVALPPGPALAPPPVLTASVPESESGLAPKTGIIVTAVALVLSVIYQVGGHAFIHSSDVIDVSLRRALVLTVAFYVVVGAGLLTFVLRARVNLVWHRYGVPHALLLGLPLGIAGGLVGVGLNSAATGHLASDPNVTALVGGGGAARLFLTFVTVSVLAPLVEETIFRGICAGSLLARSTRQAVWLSAIAFAVWHLNPAALRYYALMGLVFAGIWLKRGLLASMSAHAAFNGVLTIAAVMATSGTSATTDFNGISVMIPGGWHVDHTSSLPDRMLVAGPSGSALALLIKPDTHPQDSIGSIESRLNSAQVQAGVSIDPSSITEVTTTIGPAVTGDFSIANQPGHVIEFPYQGSIYELIIITAGNPAAERSWHDITSSLRAS